MPSFEILSGRMIGDGHPCFIVAEIGQNHQGSMKIAKELIFSAKECGVDCVKFQKSNLETRFNKSALKRKYNSPNSWGITYGEHRQFLEFSEEEFIELQEYAKSLEIPFAASGMDEDSIDFLHDIGVPFLKIGSGDANNLPLLAHAAALGKPIIVSTGMQDMEMVLKVYNAVSSINKTIGILQCTSCYPVSPKNVHLNVIVKYRQAFPEAVIGYSGHETGIGISIAAVALGAKILERHFTLDNTWKGSDHVASLEPSEMKQLVQEIRKVEAALISTEKQLLECELDCYNKLGKTVVAKQKLKSGTVLRDEFLAIKVAEPKGCKAEDLHTLVGRTLNEDIDVDSSISIDQIS